MAAQKSVRKKTAAGAGKKTSGVRKEKATRTTAGSVSRPADGRKSAAEKSSAVVARSERTNVRCRFCFLVDGYLSGEKKCHFCGSQVFAVDKA